MRTGLRTILAAALVCGANAGTRAQDSATEGAAPPQSAKRTGFLDPFFDDEDGKLDFSESLSQGGFVPIPVIVTEPAVDGGFGLMAQFVDMPDGNPGHATRRILGAVKTGNGSYGVGYFQSGRAFDGRVSYRFAAAHGKATLDIYPQFAPEGITYTNRYSYAVLGSALWHLPDERFSIGPLVDFRHLKSSVKLPEIPGLPGEFGRSLTTGALGLGVHFDSRDNPLSPTAGVNAFVEGKANDRAFGSDRDFRIYDADIYAFTPLSPGWRLGAKGEVDAARGDFPVFFAPAIDLRGVQAAKFQGSTAFSAEVELVRQLSERWSVLAFAGFGATDAGSSRFFDDEGGIVAGGAGFRYRIARKMGLDAGLDIAAGPDGAIVYIQFGHAWSAGMD